MEMQVDNTWDDIATIGLDDFRIERRALAKRTVIADGHEPITLDIDIAVPEFAIDENVAVHYAHDEPSSLLRAYDQAQNRTISSMSWYAHG